MKRTFSFAILAILVCCPGFARKQKNDARLTSPGFVYLCDSFPLYDSLQKEIHEYAEVGYHEFRSSEALCSHLEMNGFSVERGAAGIPTAFVASFGSGAPVIGLLAEYDALPGLGHGCGHNLLGTASVAGAVAISKWLAQGRKGTVKLFGCPAEEGGGGKAYMVREGVFDGLDAVLDWHPDIQNTVNEESGLANVQVRFVFKGRSAHASGSPESGRSALDAVESFDYMMNLMREHVPSSSRIHYVITDGGKAPNVVPDHAEVLYYFRSPDREIVRDIFGRALKAARGAAMGTGTTVEYEVMSGNYERLPNHRLSLVIYDNLKTVGGVEYDNSEMAYAVDMMKKSGVSDVDSALAGIRNVVPPGRNELSKWVSSDVGNVTWVAPTGSFRAASFVPAGAGHCWQQVESGGTTIGTKGLLLAAKVLYLTAIDLMMSPSILQEINDEFETARGDGFVFNPLMGDRIPPFDYQIGR